MNVELQRSAEKGSLEIQPRLQKFYKDNSTAYGKHLDNISEGLTERGEQLTKGEMNSIFRKTIDDAVEAELPLGRPQAIIEKMLKKYGIRSEPIKIIKTGKTIPGKTAFGAEEISFREAFNDIKTITNSLTQGVQAGRQGFSAEEVIVAILKKNWGDIVSARVPEFAKLQKAYSPIIQLMKKSHKIFKPFQGPFETKTGTQFLKRSGELEAGEQRFLTALEKGKRGFAKGVGPISKEPRALQARIKLTEQLRGTTKEAISRQQALKQSQLNQEIQKWSNRLTDLEKLAVYNQWKKRAAGAAGGAYLLYLLKRRAVNSLSDVLSGGFLGGSDSGDF